MHLSPKSLGPLIASMLVFCLVVSSSDVHHSAIADNLEPNSPETQTDRDQRIKWWREARFGMFIHWGIYSLPAGEYNGKRSKNVGEWIMEWANIPRLDYEKF